MYGLAMMLSVLRQLQVKLLTRYPILEETRNLTTFGDSNMPFVFSSNFRCIRKCNSRIHFPRKSFFRFEQYVSTMQDCIDHCWLHKLLNSCMTPQRKTCQSTCTFYNESLFSFNTFKPQRNENVGKKNLLAGSQVVHQPCFSDVPGLNLAVCSKIISWTRFPILI